MSNCRLCKVNITLSTLCKFCGFMHYCSKICQDKDEPHNKVCEEIAYEQRQLQEQFDTWFEENAGKHLWDTTQLPRDQIWSVVIKDTNNITDSITVLSFDYIEFLGNLLFEEIGDIHDKYALAGGINLVHDCYKNNSALVVESHNPAFKYCRYIIKLATAQ